MPAKPVDWDVWISDSLTPPRSKSYVRARLDVAVTRTHFTIISGPLALVPTDRYVGQWVLRIRDPFGIAAPYVQERVREMLHGTGLFLARPLFAVKGAHSVSLSRGKRGT